MKQSFRSRAAAGLATAGLAALLALFLWSPRARFGHDLEQASYDSLHRLGSTVSLTNSPVMVVYLDLESYLGTHQDPSQPWSRNLHAELIRRLTVAGAKAIIFDVVFSGAGSNSASDEAFAEAMQSSGRVVLAAELNASSHNPGNATWSKAVTLRLPDEPFVKAAKRWGLASLNIDDDFVVRRYFPGFLPEQPSLTWAAAGMLNIQSESAEREYSSASLGTRAWVRYYGPALTVPYLSYSTALRKDDVRDETFRDKIIFVGARPFVEGFTERRDELRNPLRSWRDNQRFMPAVEIHATQMLNLVRGDWLQRLAAPWEIAVLLTVSVIFGFGLMWLRPVAASAAAVGGAGGFLALSCLGFRHGIWFPWLIVTAVQIPAAAVSSILFHTVEWYRTRRRLEAAKRIADAKIREQAALIDKAHDAILVQDLDGRVLYANPSAAKTYGWSLEELQQNGRTIFEPSEARAAEARSAVLAKGDWSGEMRQQTRSGAILTVETRWTLIRDESGRPKELLIINSDITDKKQLEHQLLRAQRMETIGSLAGGMAHDLNNALSPVLLGVQLLRRKSADEETSRILGLMETSTHRGADMVRQVLLFARGRDGDFQDVNIGALIKELAKMARETFPKNIVIETFVPEDLHAVRGNVTQLHQVLLNLCVNARDAMPVGGRLTILADNARVEANAGSATSQGDHVSLMVCDTGTGIAPEAREKIFEPFYTTKGEGKGTGIGLATVQRIVKSHRGSMRVESTVGEGTTFEILLPRAESSAFSQAETQSQERRGNGEVILLVDDEQAIRDLLKEGLTENGYTVLTAADGAEAWQVFKASSAAVLITDSGMPLLDGAQLIAKVREVSPQLPVIITGAGTETANVENAARLRKPFSLGELLALIPAMVGKQQGHRTGLDEAPFRSIR